MILVTADLHLNDLPRDAYRHDWMRTILPSLLRKHKAELLLILGDISDEKDHLSAWLVNTTVDHLAALAKICPVVVERGNHDYIDVSNPFYEFLGRIPGLAWVNHPTAAGDLPFENNLGSTLFLPHTFNYKRDWTALDFTNYDLVFAHQTFQGARVGPRKMEGIPTDIFPKDALVFSGDIHEPQEFDQIVYIGSPFRVDFGDDFDPRVIALDPVALTYKSIPSPGPQKRLIEVGSVAGLKKQRANPGDLLKVRIQITPAQAPQWNAIKGEVKAWGEKNEFHIYLVQPQVVNAASGKANARKADTRSDEQLLELYAQSRAVNETTLKTGKTLMGKV